MPIPTDTVKKYCQVFRFHMSMASMALGGCYKRPLPNIVIKYRHENAMVREVNIEKLFKIRFIFGANEHLLRSKVVRIASPLKLHGNTLRRRDEFSKHGKTSQAVAVNTRDSSANEHGADY